MVSVGDKIDYLQCFLGAENNDFVGVLQCARDRKQRGVGGDRITLALRF